MTTNPLFIVALVLFEGAAVVWAVWEMWSIRKSKADKANALASKEPPRHAEGEHDADEG